MNSITVMCVRLLNAFFFFFIQVDLLNSLCFYVRFYQNDNSSNNIKNKTQDGAADGRGGELKYEMHLALAQYNGPAFLPHPPSTTSSCQTAVLSSSSSGNLDCFT